MGKYNNGGKTFPPIDPDSWFPPPDDTPVILVTGRDYELELVPEPNDLRGGFYPKAGFYNDYDGTSSITPERWIFKASTGLIGFLLGADPITIVVTWGDYRPCIEATYGEYRKQRDNLIDSLNNQLDAALDLTPGTRRGLYNFLASVIDGYLGKTIKRVPDENNPQMLVPTCEDLKGICCCYAERTELVRPLGPRKVKELVGCYEDTTPEECENKLYTVVDNLMITSYQTYYNFNSQEEGNAEDCRRCMPEVHFVWCECGEDNGIIYCWPHIQTVAALDVNEFTNTVLSETGVFAVEKFDKLTVAQSVYRERMKTNYCIENAPETTPTPTPEVFSYHDIP